MLRMRWLILLLPSLAWSASSPTTSPSSVGRTSAAEARILWEDGTRALEDGQFAIAERALSRLLDRYPGHVHYLDAQHALGRAFLGLKKAQPAIDVLRAYVEAAGAGESGFRGRLDLGRAYLMAGKNHEAIVMADSLSKITEDLRLKASTQTDKVLAEKQRELTDLTERGDEVSDGGAQRIEELRREIFDLSYPEPGAIDALHLEALLLRTWGLLRLKDDAKALAVLASFDQLYPRSNHPTVLETRAQSARIGVEIKIRECERLPSAGRMNERQARDQMRRRGMCLLEAMVLFRQGLQSEPGTGPVRWAEESRSLLSRAFASYARVCGKPPRPADARTAAELRAYRAELSSVLARDLAQTRTQAVEMLQLWKKSLPKGPAMVVDRLAVDLKRG